MGKSRTGSCEQIDFERSNRQIFPNAVLNQKDLRHGGNRKNDGFQFTHSFQATTFLGDRRKPGRRPNRIWALDRFSREGVLETLNSYGVEWKRFTEQYLDSAGIFKDAIIGVMATPAKQERIKISERTPMGLKIARAMGKHIGRPQKVFDRAEAVAMRRRGDSFGTIAKQFGISRTTALRLAREAGL